MFKKIVAVVLVIALTAAASIAGTMAYLQSEDSDVNVMTLGNVEIKQHEYERAVKDGTYETKEIDGVNSYVLEAFEQGKPLYPIVGDPSTGAAGWDNTIVRMTQVDSYGSMQVFAGKNAQDKFVTVENTGKSDAYIRTIVAIEVGSGNADLIGTSYHSTWEKNILGVMEINGNNYYVIEYTYNGGDLGDGTWRHKGGILPAGDTSYPNLSQIYLKSVATNEDCEALDGNGNGTLDVLVLSQAVQTEGFDSAAAAMEAAFSKGESNANVPGWFEGGEFDIPVIVNSFEEMVNICKTGGSMVLAKDLVYTAENTEEMIGGSIFLINNKNVKLDLNGHNIEIAEDATDISGAIFFVGNPNGHLDIVGDGEITVKNGLATVVWTLQSGTANIYGGNFTSNSVANEAMLYSQGNGGVINVYGGKYTYDLQGHLNGGFNVSDNAGSALRIVIHEGVLLSRPEYSQHLQGTSNGEEARIQLAEGCELQEVVIEGTTWYQVVKK